jgi:hypothetical protein
LIAAWLAICPQFAEPEQGNKTTTDVASQPHLGGLDLRSLLSTSMLFLLYFNPNISVNTFADFSKSIIFSFIYIHT